jgi:hypothetical protein
MFLIASGREPGSVQDLRRGLEEGLCELLGPISTDGCVEVLGAWPHLERLIVDLTGMRVDPRQPPLVPKGLTPVAKDAALTSQGLELRAEPLWLGESARLGLALEASRAELAVVRDDQRRLWLLPQHFATGQARLEMAAEDLEQLFLEGASRAAADHGVSIEKGRLSLEQSGVRELRIQAELLARKLFVRSHIVIKGHVGFDEQLNLHFSNMSCAGKGMVAGIACKFIQPHLDAWEERSLSLLSLAFPAVRLRHARLTTDSAGRLEATAELGEVG